MQLIHSNKKNTKELLFTKACVENQKQTQRKNETIDKTKEKNSFDQKTS